MKNRLQILVRHSTIGRISSSLMAERKAILVLTIFTIIFFYKFFFLGYMYSPADILSHSYYPWITRTDLREQYPQNKPLRKIVRSGEKIGIGPVLSHPSNYEVADVVFVGIPATHFSVNEIKKGNLPFWNDHLLCGFNQFADITYSPYYPLNIIYFIPGITPMQGTTIKIIISIYLLGVFFYFMARDMGISRFAATSASLVIMFCLPVISFAIFISFLDAYIWLPLLILLYRLYLREKNGLYLIFAALATCSMVFSRNPKPISYICVFLGLYQIATILFFREMPIKLWQKCKLSIFFSFFSFAVGILLASILTMPMFEAIKMGGRMEGQDTRMFLNIETVLEYFKAASDSPPHTVVVKSLAKITSIGLFFPKFFGAATDIKIWLPIAYVEISTYMGLIPLVFVAWSAFHRKSRQEWFYLCLSVYLYLVFLYMPLFFASFCFFIPTSGIPRVLPIIAFCIAILFGTAIDKILAKFKKAHKNLGVIGISIALGTFLVSTIIVVSIVAGSDFFYKLCNLRLYHNIGHFSGIPTFSSTAAEFNKYHFKNFLVMAFFAASTLVYALRPMLLQRKSLFLGILFCQLAFFGVNVLPTTREKYAYFNTETTDFIKNHIGDYRIARFGSRIVMPSGALAMYNVSDAMTAVCSVAPIPMFGIYNALDPNSDTNTTVGIAGFSNAAILQKKIIDAMAIKYIISERPINEIKNSKSEKKCITDLTKDIADASIKQPGPNFIAPATIAIDNNGFNGIIANPPAEIVYKYQLPKNAFLDFGVAMNPECWSPDKGDGVTFEVLIEEEGNESSVYKRTINPKSVPSDRKIFWESIDLSEYAGKYIRLKLKTDPLLSSASDWAFWVTPRIMTLNEVEAISSPLDRYKNVWDKEGCYIYEDIDVLPRAFLSFGAIDSASLVPEYDIATPLFPNLKAESRRVLGMLVSDGYDPRKNIIIEGDKGLDNKEGVLAKPVTYKKLKNYEYIYTTEADIESYLYVADTYDPGWKAIVDGKPTDIIKANHAFRAVYLPPGKHTVVMTFTPKGYILGRNLTFCGLALLLICALTQALGRKYKKMKSI
jgi:hypothetical protein